MATPLFQCTVLDTRDARLTYWEIILQKETRILDAPLLSDDYYSNVMDWGKSNLLAVVLGRKLYIWNDEVKKARVLTEVKREHDYPTSVAWSDDAKIVAVGCISSKLQLWDAETSILVSTSS